MAIIFHVDMDAFFVACEIRENPSLAGRSVVVGADPKGGGGRGVVSTASYEARKFGVHSAMPISIAYRKCPKCVYLPVNMELYVETSRKIFSMIREHVLKLEQVSIDEAFFTADDTYEEAGKTAGKIKDLVRKEGFTCSIGIGPNKTIAKIASDFRKPDGLTIVRPEEAKSFLAPMPVRKLPGIGPKTESVLASQKIKLIGDIASRNETYFTNLFGRWGAQMFWLANGYGSDAIDEEKGARSISREVTFEKDTADEKQIKSAIDGLAEDLHATISRHGMSFRSIAIKVRYEGWFETHTRQKTLKVPASSVGLISDTANELVRSFLGRKKIRLIGVKLSGFEARQADMKKFLK
jgi:DNA polymerase IV (DinB-like DNA polymerase)